MGLLFHITTQFGLGVLPCRDDAAQSWRASALEQTHPGHAWHPRPSLNTHRSATRWWLLTLAGELCLHVDASDHAEQLAVRGGDDRGAERTAAEPLGQLGQGAVGPHGGGAGLHDLLGPCRRVALERGLAQSPEQRRVLGDHPPQRRWR
jgi:hypothetical protein